MKYGLSDTELQKITGVLRSHPCVNQAVLYGSRAKGNFKKSSDIDLTIKGRELNLLDLSKVIIDLDDLLLPYKIDLSIYHHIKNDQLIEHIARVGQTIYKSA